MKESNHKYILELYFLNKHQSILMQWVNNAKWQKWTNKWMATYNKYI